MEIETINRAITRFADINFGKCFTIKSCPYMKIISSNLNDRDDSYINAINLINGSCTFIAINTAVTKVNAKLVIEE